MIAKKKKDKVSGSSITRVNNNNHYFSFCYCSFLSLKKMSTELRSRSSKERPINNDKAFRAEGQNRPDVEAAK
jgi:hypothetical protein